MNENDAIIDQIAKEVTQEVLQEIANDPFWPIENNPNNPVFSKESVQELQMLAEQWQHIIDASEEWFTRYAHPLFDQCKTMEDYKRVLQAMPAPSDKERQPLALPGNIHVNLAYAADSVCQKIAKEK
jgi:hypothetical protein